MHFMVSSRNHLLRMDMAIWHSTDYDSTQTKTKEPPVGREGETPGGSNS
jgi:hypothetical protein